MKKLTFPCICVLLLASKMMFAQYNCVSKNSAIPVEVKTANIIQNAKILSANRMACPDDSLYSIYLDRSSSIYGYNSAGGYPSGTNKYTAQIGMHYTFTGSGYITDLYVLFGAKEIIGNPDTWKAYVYNVGTDSLPKGTAIATATFTTADVDTAWLNFTVISFATPVIVNGDFVVAIETANSSNNDSILVRTNVDGDALGERRTVQKFRPPQGTSWKKADDIWCCDPQCTSTCFDNDAMIAPVFSSSYITADIGSNRTVCSGKDITIASTVTGVNPPFTYLWSTGATTSSITLKAVQQPDTIAFEVTNSLGCTAVDTILISVASPSVNVDAGADVSICPSGSTNLSATGGVSYTWSPAYGLSNVSVSNPTASPAINTKYYVTAIDSNGCTVVDSLTVGIRNIPGITTVSVTNANCDSSDGSATVSAFGTTAPYTYSWTNGATASAITGIAGGIYTVTVTDANGCNSKSNVGVGNSTAPSLVITGSSNVTCYGSNDGQASVSVSSGTSPFVYLWSNSQTFANATTLTGGVQIVKVIDSVGCIGIASVTISEPAKLVAVVNKSDASCKNDDGSVLLTVSGGTPGYTYKWSNSSTSEDIAGLSAGTYTFTVLDSKGCRNINSESVQKISDFSANILKANIKCNGEVNGSVTAEAIGGTAPYTYFWSTGHTTAAVTDLAAGTYSVTIIDNIACKVTNIATITQPVALTTSVSVTYATDSSSAKVKATVAGGTAPYGYGWSNGSNATSSINVTQSGTYTVNVTDANNCASSGSATVIRVGVKDLNSYFDNIHLYPNPTDGKLTINVQFGKIEEIHVEIYNILGDKIKNNITNTMKNGLFTIDLSAMPQGLYLIRIQAGNKATTRKVTLTK